MQSLSCKHSFNLRMPNKTEIMREITRFLSSYNKHINFHTFSRYVENKHEIKITVKRIRFITNPLNNIYHNLIISFAWTLNLQNNVIYLAVNEVQLPSYQTSILCIYHAFSSLIIGRLNMKWGTFIEKTWPFTSNRLFIMHSIIKGVREWHASALWLVYFR